MFRKRNSKKVISLIMSLLIAVSICGCGSNSTPKEPVDVLLITDYGTVKDGSFNEGAWDGISQYASDNGIIAAYYEPTEVDKDIYLSEIKRGVDNGAKVIVCPGYLLEETVFDAQKMYPDTHFILLDGEPHNEDYSDTTIGNNVMPILFAEEEAGFLAGYAAVRDGYTGLGFIGGIPEAPVIRFGYGFVQGADYAAIEMGVNVHIRYHYANTFYEDQNVQNLAGTWFDDDTEVIFACGGAMGRSVMRAAETHDGKVIGVDVDQSFESNTVITSAMKSLSNAVYYGIQSYYDGTFPGGSVTRFTAKDDGVCLPMDNSKFNRFGAAEYNGIFSRIVEGYITPYAQTDIGTTKELTLINTEVTYIE